MQIILFVFVLLGKDQLLIGFIDFHLIHVIDGIEDHFGVLVEILQKNQSVIRPLSSFMENTPLSK